MARFTDNDGREWEILLDAPTAIRIREDCDEAFLKDDFNPGKASTYQRMQEDPVLLCRVVYLLCEQQIKERGMTDRQFYLSVLGDAIDRATEALLQAIVNFTPRRDRQMMEALVGQGEMQREAIEQAIAKVDNPEIREKVKQAVTEMVEQRVATMLTRLNTVTASPESSESTPKD